MQDRLDPESNSGRSFGKQLLHSQGAVSMRERRDFQRQETYLFRRIDNQLNIDCDGMNRESYQGSIPLEPQKHGK